jgi:hypothetical protein
MRGIAFRRVLPPIQVVLFISLFATGYLHGQADIAAGVCDPTADMPCQSGADDLAFALSLPAVGMAFTISEILGVGTNLAVQISICSVAVFFFWYLIGCWLDRMYGVLPRKPMRVPSWLVWASAWLGLLICLLLGTVGLYFWFRGGFAIPKYNLTEFCIFLWSALGAAILLTKLFRWHALANAKKQGNGIATPS